MSLFFTLISYIFVVFSPLFFLFLGVGSNSFMGDDDRELKHEAGSRILQESSLSSTAFLEADFYKPGGCLLLLIRVLVFSAIFDYSRLQKVQVLIPGFIFLHMADLHV
ncbi:uncharacterized protein LOC109712920 isoform X1 [Ananas comosus]|uniref:Uncharacterized protein LOC109712920 isoform X1 n=1 Tax=Ananas comosus TaxID=4615 RepID=A0A6P5F810_ANACO|nr:uncharacterized protein LOC109712920 isoform X1 [Ananas comosus]